jgi:hypothetical protein
MQWARRWLLIDRACAGFGSHPWGVVMARSRGTRVDIAALALTDDMQRIFSAEGPWPMPWMERVLPVVVTLASRHPERTVFTRFIPPERLGADGRHVAGLLADGDPRISGCRIARADATSFGALSARNHHQ